MNDMMIYGDVTDHSCWLLKLSTWSMILHSEEVVIVVIITISHGTLGRPSLNHEHGHHVRELCSLREAVHYSLGTAAAGSTGGDQTEQEAGEQSCPPGKE